MKRIQMSPALNAEEIDYLTKFSETRRMLRKKGPYYVGAGWRFCQETESDVINYNKPGEDQPSLWCYWTPTSCGTALVWSDSDTRDAAAWKLYLVEHFIGSEPAAKGELPFLQGHTYS